MASARITIQSAADTKGTLLFRLGRGFSYSLLGQFAGYAITFFLAPFYTHAMGPSEFGVVATMNSIRSMLLMLMPMSTAGAVTYWFNIHRNDRPSQRASMGGISGLALLLSLLWLAGTLIAGPALQHYFFSSLPLSFWPYGAMVVVSAWLLSLQSIPMAVLAAEERQNWYAIISTAIGLCQAGAIIVMVVLLHRGAGGQVQAMFMASLAAAAIFLWLMMREAPPRVDFSLWKKVAIYAIPIVPHQLSIWGLNLSDRLIIAHYGARFAHDLGLYSFGYAVAMIMQAVVSAFNAIWAPVYMEQARCNKNAEVVLGRLSSWSCLGLAVAASGLILFSPNIVALMGGPKYMGSIRFIAPVILAYFMQGIYQFPTMALFHTGKTKMLPIITASAALVNIGLNLALIPHYGVIVAAWSTLVGFTLMAVIAFAICQPIFRLVYPIRPLIAAVAFLGGAYWLQRVSGGGMGLLAIKALLWCAALLVVAKLFRAEMKLFAV